MVFRSFSAVLIVLVCTACIAQAVTWRVEKDGSGDWYTIQAAVEASADGDTILIGPGRYADRHPAPVSEVVAYWDDPKELYFIGRDRDSVTIGPEEYIPSETPNGSYGFNYAGTSKQHFAGLSFENLDRPISATGIGAWVDDCQTIECSSGVHFYNAQEGVVSNCVFFRTVFSSVALGVSLRNTQDVVVESCEFFDMIIYLHGTWSNTIRYCTFQNATRLNAVTYYGSDGVFEYNETNSFIAIDSNCEVQVRNNVFHQGPESPYNIYIANKFPVVQVSGNIFEGGSYCSLYLSTYASLSGIDNHILRGSSEFSVVLSGYGGIYPSDVDLRNNYWGTSDPDSIAAMIYDGNDDHTIQQTVQFDPFSAVPLDTKKEALGGFKSMFR